MDMSGNDEFGYGFKYDNTAFLYTLTNPASMPLIMKIKPGKEQYAVQHSDINGPTFGYGEGYASDLSVSDEYGFIYSGMSYDAPNGYVGLEGGNFLHGNYTENVFQTVEIEVFQIV